MPLPFLTADRASGAMDEAVLFDDRERWRRPYRPGPCRVGAAALLLLFASFVLLAGVVTAFTATLSSAAASFGLALAVIAGTLRLLRMGVWVSTRGLRHVGFFVTRTTPWPQVAEVRVVQQPVRWLGLPRTVQGQALVLTRRGHGAQDLPPLLTTHNADFLGRLAAFDRAADVVEAWAEENRSR
ncbi:membrane protein [Streptomyces sp. F-3]|uniref:Membrane protein n=1 Tax=Streptomyces thermogriseus TaxID=75292 RepID=A0ABN1T633_9ACTN|nr:MULTISPECIES: PH domain-containing protein [Streptomyces]MDN5384806.1 PH domain-containing protein [Streptomyces sp. LB8]GAT84151.1 membrane protein [Streptomyces sp. F-3]